MSGFIEEHDLKIGLVGYYNHGNYGDQLFAKVFQETFSDCRITVLANAGGGPNFDPDLISQQDCIIVGGGDLVIPFAFAEQYWNDALLSKPVYIVGVGVPTWGGYSKDATLAMRRFFQDENVKLVVARDPASRDWITKHLQPRVPVSFYPDLAAALPFEREPHSKRTLGIILRAHQNIDYPNLRKFLARAAEFGYDINNIVLGIDNVAVNDLVAAKQLDFPLSKIVVGETIDDLTRQIALCDLVVSQKFHGCVVALMMGIPCIALSGSDKFVSFLEFFQKELFITTANDPRLIHRLINPMYDISASDVTRIRAEARKGLLHVRSAIKDGEQAAALTEKGAP